MKRWTGIVTAAAFAVTCAALAQTEKQTTSEKQEKSSNGTMHMESTTKQTGPGPNSKTKTETVVGTVQSYEAGKKIVVTGPHDKKYTFDLDENAAVKGTFAEGDRVKVSYTKTDGGDRVTTVMAYPEKKTKKPAA